VGQPRPHGVPPVPEALDGQIAVKVISDYGDEVVKVLDVSTSAHAHPPAARAREAMVALTGNRRSTMMSVDASGAGDRPLTWLKSRAVVEEVSWPQRCWNGLPP
jgi:hypothetical protein